MPFRHFYIVFLWRIFQEDGLPAFLSGQLSLSPQAGCRMRVSSLLLVNPPDGVFLQLIFNQVVMPCLEAHGFFSSDSHFFFKRFTFFSQAKISGCSCRCRSKSVPLRVCPENLRCDAFRHEWACLVSGCAAAAGRIFCFPAGCPGLRTGDFSGRLLFPVICCFLYKPPRFPFGCLLVLLMWLAVFF